MNASTPFRFLLIGPAAAIFAAGAAMACPPESGEGSAAPMQLLEHEDLGALLELRAREFNGFLSLEPSMAVFSGGKGQQQEGVFFGPGEGQKRYRVLRPSGGRAEAQTFTATRGNGQASAKARAELGELQWWAEAQREDAQRLEEVNRDQATRAMVLRRQAVRGQAPNAPRSPVPPAPPAPPLSADSEVIIEGHAIIVGPDGQVYERTLRGMPSGPSATGNDAARQFVLERRVTAEADDRAVIDRTQIQRVWVGLELAEPEAGIVRYFGLEPGQTTQIARVFDDSPAAEAGLKDQDIVIKVNGNAMAGPDILREVVSATEPGDSIRITVLRSGRTHAIDLRPALRDQPTPAAARTSPSKPAVATSEKDLERRMQRIEQLLQKLLEEESRD